MACIALVLYLVLRTPSGNVANSVTAYAEMGELVVKVIESGEIEAERREVISNELRWPVFISSLVPDGTQVKKDDLIVVFECKELIDAIDQQKIYVNTSTSDYTQADENKKMKQKEVDFDVTKAEHDLTEAKENLRRYENGDWPTQWDRSKSDIQLAQSDLTLAQGKLDFKKTANADPELKKPYSDSEIKADELALSRLEFSLSKATMDKKILEQYEHPQKLRQLTLAIKMAELTLEKAQTSARTEMMVAESSVDARKATLKTQKSKLDDMLEQEKKLTVKASRDGLVVYNTGRRWWDNPVVVEVGAKLDPRQQIMIIPDMTSLQIKTRVYEARIDQVQIGAEAFVRLDAKPDVILKGKVDKVAPLPDSQNRENPTAKVYNVYVKLDNNIEGLKPNMTAQCEMVLARLSNVLTVPVAAVFAEQERRYCYRTNKGRAERVAIKIGSFSDTRVEVVAGLNAGDVLLLNPPPEMLDQKSDQDKDKDKDKDRDKPQTQPAPPPPADRSDAKEIAHP